MKTAFPRLDVGEKTVCNRRGCSELIPRDWHHCVGFGLYECLHHRGNEMNRKIASETKPEQTLLSGVLTEDEVFRSVMRRLGAKGGKANTEKQRQQRMANVDKMLSARREKRKQQQP